jgi:hypothetical protein
MEEFGDARRTEMLGYDYPLLGVFWTVLWFALLFIWIWLLIRVFMDIFRSRDLGGFAKALWVIFVIVLPFLGVFIYLIARGKGMEERTEERAARNDQQYRDSIPKVAP